MTAKFIEIDGDIVNIDHVVFVGQTSDASGMYAGVLSLSNGVTRNILDEASLKRAKRELLTVQKEKAASP
jgi:hypothetical protein